MSSLAFFASPIDFQKNEILEHKINKEKQNKLNKGILEKMVLKPENELTDDINNIHNNLNDALKDENESTLANFYNDEMKEDIHKQMTKTESSQDMYNNEITSNDYLISNNLNLNSIHNSHSLLSNLDNREDLLSKLNYIINLFEEEREIKTNKKNEEIVLYCFLGIFVIYVLDSFVSIGKYKR
tara:strand:- start:930 stop:1481 length:552 start_codon:yes stop_codon:yes gene_type:complete